MYWVRAGCRPKSSSDMHCRHSYRLAGTCLIHVCTCTTQDCVWFHVKVYDLMYNTCLNSECMYKWPFNCAESHIHKWVCWLCGCKKNQGSSKDRDCLFGKALLFSMSSEIEAKCLNKKARWRHSNPSVHKFVHVSLRFFPALFYGYEDMRRCSVWKVTP